MTPTKRAKGSVFQRSQDGRWLARVTLPDGKRVTRYAKDKGEAEVLLAALLTTPDLTPASALTVGVWVDYFVEQTAAGLAASTTKERRIMAKKIGAGLGKTRLDKLTAQQVQKWAESLTGQHSTKRKMLGLLRLALTRAVALGHISRNVALAAQLERQPRKETGAAWTQGEAQQFLERTEGHRLHLIWKLGLQTGARIGELIALRVDDWDRAGKVLHIERTAKPAAEDNNRKAVGPPKTPFAVRRFPVTKDIQATLEAAIQQRLYLAAHTSGWQDEGWLFPNQFGGMLMYGNVRREWGPAIEAAGVPKIRMHDMRHTFITLAARRGLKPEVVARLVGHADPTITLKIYRKVLDDEMSQAARELEGLL